MEKVNESLLLVRRFSFSLRIPLTKDIINDILQAYYETVLLRMISRFPAPLTFPIENPTANLWYSQLISNQ